MSKQLKTLTLDDSFSYVYTKATSKGIQKKWTDGNIWVKADYLGYEGLAEYYVSQLLKCTTLPTDQYIEYHPCNIIKDGESYTGCYSYNFLNEDEELLTFGRILETLSISQQYIDNIKNLDERISVVMSSINSYLNIDIYDYVSTILHLDKLIFNEDRHLYNFAVIYNINTRQIRQAPIFDNGLSLLSDITDYPITTPVDICLRRVKSKPFSTKFSNQAGRFKQTFYIYLDKFNKLLDTLDRNNPHEDRIYRVLATSYLRYKDMFI